MIPFKDISYAQGNYNMAANTDPIIAIRMSSGDGGLHFDTQATRNYEAASAAGKVIIQYHFAGLGDAGTEAKFFIEACSPFIENDIYCLDHELGQTPGWCQTFAQVVHDATGCWVLDYENISLANSMGVIPNCGLWLAAPSWGFDQTITELDPNIVYVAQQGPIVNGVDTDAWFGTLDELKKYGYHAPTAPAPAPVAPPAPTPAPVVEPTIPATPVVPSVSAPLPSPGSTVTPTPVEAPSPVVGQGSTTVVPVRVIHKSWFTRLVEDLIKLIKGELNGKV